MIVKCNQKHTLVGWHLFRFWLHVSNAGILDVEVVVQPILWHFSLCLMPPNEIVSDKMAPLLTLTIPHSMQLLAHMPHLAHVTRKEIAWRTGNISFALNSQRALHPWIFPAWFGSHDWVHTVNCHMLEKVNGLLVRSWTMAVTGQNCVSNVQSTLSVFMIIRLPDEDSLMNTAWWRLLMKTAWWRVPDAWCLMPDAWCLMKTAWWILPDENCLMKTARWRLPSCCCTDSYS